MVIKFGPPVLESSTEISKFYAPTDSKHKSDKTETENWLLIVFNVESSWLGICSHNHYTTFNC